MTSAGRDMMREIREAVIGVAEKSSSESDSETSAGSGEELSESFGLVQPGEGGCEGDGDPEGRTEGVRGERQERVGSLDPEGERGGEPEILEFAARRLRPRVSRMMESHETEDCKERCKSVPV